MKALREPLPQCLLLLVLNLEIELGARCGDLACIGCVASVSFAEIVVSAVTLPYGEELRPRLMVSFCIVPLLWICRDKLNCMKVSGRFADRYSVPEPFVGSIRSRSQVHTSIY